MAFEIQLLLWSGGPNVLCIQPHIISRLKSGWNMPFIVILGLVLLCLLNIDPQMFVELLEGFGLCFSIRRIG